MSPLTFGVVLFRGTNAGRTLIGLIGLKYSFLSVVVLGASVVNVLVAALGAILVVFVFFLKSMGTF